MSDFPGLRRAAISRPRSAVDTSASPRPGRVLVTPLSLQLSLDSFLHEVREEVSHCQKPKEKSCGEKVKGNPGYRSRRRQPGRLDEMTVPPGGWGHGSGLREEADSLSTHPVSEAKIHTERKVLRQALD